jgi:signal peptidase II
MSYLMLLAIVLGMDIITKYLVQQNMLLHQTIPVIPGFLSLTYIENPGAAFGLLANVAYPWRQLLFIAVSILALIIIVVLFFKSPPEEQLSKTALTLILAGALGNLVDRLRLGVVVDFIDLYWRGFHWPAFNVADSAISIGVGMLIIDLLLKQRTTPG